MNQKEPHIINSLLDDLSSVDEQSLSFFNNQMLKTNHQLIGKKRQFNEQQNMGTDESLQLLQNVIQKQIKQTTSQQSFPQQQYLGLQKSIYQDVVYQDQLAQGYAKDSYQQIAAELQSNILQRGHFKSVEFEQQEIFGDMQKNGVQRPQQWRNDMQEEQQKAQKQDDINEQNKKQDMNQIFGLNLQYESSMNSTKNNNTAYNKRKLSNEQLLKQLLNRQQICNKQAAEEFDDVESNQYLQNQISNENCQKQQHDKEIVNQQNSVESIAANEIQPQDSQMEEGTIQDEVTSECASPSKKKDKKLVFLSRSVLQCVRENPNTSGTNIANKILVLYKQFGDNVDFKNVQRRVYDAVNVLQAMDVIRKEGNTIVYNPDNEFIDDTIEPTTVPASARNNSIKKQYHTPQRPIQSTKVKNDTLASKLEQKQLMTASTRETNSRAINLKMRQNEKEKLTQRLDESKKRIKKMQQKQQWMQQLFAKSQCHLNQNRHIMRQQNQEIQKKQFDIEELVQQYISRTKIITRNRNLNPNRQCNESYHLPFCLIRPRAKIQSLGKPDKQRVEIHCKKKLRLLSENHLFEGMGLSQMDTRNRQKEVQEIFELQNRSELWKMIYDLTIKNDKQTAK